MPWHRFGCCCVEQTVYQIIRVELLAVRRIDGGQNESGVHSRVSVAIRIGPAANDVNMTAARRTPNYGLICPAPRMRYLNVVSCSTPTGPRACMRPVAMPISAPKPNSPPSAICVEVLGSRIAESTSLGILGAAGGWGVMIAWV